MPDGEKANVANASQQDVHSPRAAPAADTRAAHAIVEAQVVFESFIHSSVHSPDCSRAWSESSPQNG